MSNMTHFDNSYSVWNERKNFEVWVLPVLRQNPDIWNFHRSLTLNIGKLIDILEALGMLLCQI